MKTIFIIVNILLLVLFALSRYLKFSPKAKAHYGVLMGVVFAAYLILITIISFQAMWVRDWKILPLAAFLFAPFLIGKKASYETLTLWSNVQLALFAFSLTYCSLYYAYGF